MKGKFLKYITLGIRIRIINEACPLVICIDINNFRGITSPVVSMGRLCKHLGCCDNSIKLGVVERANRSGVTTCLLSFDNCKMGRKGLEDEGATKEPLPFLTDIH